jgi:hypothetical protein
MLVALTGIEPAGCRSRSVYSSLSSCIFSPVRIATIAFSAVQTADVLTWCCPAVWISAGTTGRSIHSPAVSRAMCIL